MPRQESKATQVSRLGESPAEARRRMQTSGGAGEASSETQPPLGKEVKGPLTPQHIAEIREAEEGFGGGPTSGGSVEEATDLAEPPTPSKAMEMIQQLSQDKLQLQTELSSALNVVERYRARYGELD